MRYSKLLGKTLRENPRGAEAASHQLLVRGGFLRAVGAGVFAFLPLGMRVLEKISRIVVEEWTKRGMQHISLPVASLSGAQEERERGASLKKALATRRAQHRRDYFLAEHHEETLAALAGTLAASYRELPFLLAQVRWMQREDFRGAVGLLRAREFLMHGAYSFDANEEASEQSAALLAEACRAAFARIGLDVAEIEAGSGTWASREFMALSDVGDANLFVCDTCDYKAEAELAESVFPEYEQETEPKEIKAVLGEGIIGVFELSKFLGIPVYQTTKTLLFQADDRVVAVCVRGEYDVSERKLAAVLGCTDLRLATAAVVKELTGAEVGYAGPMGLPKEVQIIWDHTTRGRVNFEAGANKTDYHYINVNFGRDVALPEKFVDIRKVKEGETCARCCRGKLAPRKAVRSAHVTALGTLYSEELGATFTDAGGKSQPMVMACCGMDTTCVLAAVVEQHNDARGILWPETIAPFAAHLVSLPGGEEKGQALYAKLLSEEVEVLWDERDESAGVKFADADLIGIPLRLVVSKKTGDQVERKRRREKTSELVSVEEVIRQLTAQRKQ